MNPSEKEFISSVPESDPAYAVKRFQINEWYRPFGKKVIISSDLPYVAEKLNNFSDAKYWMQRQSGDFILNRVSVANELLGIKGTSGRDLLYPCERYQVACWLCSEESIRKNFLSVEQYRDDLDSEAEFVTDVISCHCRLMEFWTHYIHIADKNGYLIPNPNEEILDNFKELIARYNKNYHKNLSYNSQVDLWKYGFECARKEGCVEALEFFLNKLEARITQDERDEILIDTALYSVSPSSFSVKHSSANVIDFCLANLGADKYKVLLQKDFELHGDYSILNELESSHLFGYVKELISSLEPENVSFEKYSIHLIFRTGRQVCVVPDKKLMQMRGDFLTWIWGKEGFEEHRECFLNKLSRGDPELISMLLELSKVGAFEPLEKILDSATRAGRREIAESFRLSQESCCALYIQGRKDLLNKVFDGAKYSNTFVSAIEEVLEQNPAYKQKWDCACNLDKEFRIKESIAKISELLSYYGLSHLINKKINELEQASQAGGDASSSLDDLKSIASIVSKYRTH